MALTRQMLTASAKKMFLDRNPLKSEAAVLKFVYEFVKMEMVYTYDKVKQCGGFTSMLFSECSFRICP